MPAYYPDSTISSAVLSPVTDNVTPVMAGQINPVYLEVIAIEETLGALATDYAPSTSAYVSSTTTFDSVSARIGNLEKGFNSRVVDTIGGTTIQPTSSPLVPLTIKQYSTSTSNLLEFKNSSGTTINSVSKDGHLASIDGGTA